MPSYDDINDVPQEPEYNRILLPAQRAIGAARMTDDDTDELVLEVLVLPNAQFFFQPQPNDSGVKIGDHVVTTPGYARATVTTLASECDRITECDCLAHGGKTMVPVDPDDL